MWLYVYQNGKPVIDGTVVGAIGRLYLRLSFGERLFVWTAINGMFVWGAKINSWSRCVCGGGGTDSFPNGRSPSGVTISARHNGHLSRLQVANISTHVEQNIC
jgi:hypothetical protein